jgi:multidrug efflux pump subunit AcrA (membrane-fusion protein)
MRAATRAGRSRFRHWPSLIAGIGAGLLLCGCAAKQETEVGSVVTVDVAPVVNAQIQRIVRADALLYPVQQAAIASKISAPIRRFHVERGAHVRGGQLLVELESQDLMGAARESQAAYELAEASYQTAARATLPQEGQKAELDVRVAKDTLDAQQAVFDNRQRLFQEGAIAQKDVNDALVSLSQARNQHEIARKRLEDLVGFGREQALKAAAAQRDVAKGRYDAAQAQLGYAKITSPIDGVVTDRPQYAGEFVPSGAPIVTVMDLSRMVARAHIAPSEAAELKVGSDANLIGPDGAPIPGKVTQISPALDTTSTTVEVWIQVANQEGRLRPGSSQRVEIVARTVPGALVVPEAAILTSSSGTTSVVVIDPENKPHTESVTLGIRDNGKVQVTEGLQNGQRVVTTGAFELAKLDESVLAKTNVRIQPPKEEDEK